MSISPEAALQDLPENLRTVPADRLQDVMKLQKTVQKITSILDLDELIQQVVTEVACSFGCVEINLYLHEPDERTMVLAGTHGCTLHGRGKRLRVGKDGMVGYVAATGQMRYAPDVSIDPYYIACELGTRSEVAIPLHVNGELIGVFTASHPELDGFPADQLRLFQSLCSHLAVAVHNARRFEKERSQRESMTREAQEGYAPDPDISKLPSFNELIKIAFGENGII